ncbi:predicted protein [Lichtheimia corymbifera JMRC:FSU:9682]|uniref:Uncharacterized protein n=1 Tax=Lichtheimia corymbifera JMRC:FSU:9682 TaxID=1263082 RepID=A0A068RM08_9FUNG|nr:predicted protein [Lichtheimia corymbifera JMRC:FSU:9682]
MDEWMESSAVVRSPGVLLWSLCVLPAGTIMWIQLRMMMMDWMGWVVSWRKVLYSHGFYWNAQVNACSSYFIPLDEGCLRRQQPRYNDTIIPVDSL